jgi:hypothetical protein
LVCDSVLLVRYPVSALLLSSSVSLCVGRVRLHPPALVLRKITNNSYREVVVKWVRNS